MSRRLLFAPFLLAFLCAQSATSQSPLPEAAAARAVDQLFADWDKTTSPGCSVGVFDHGRTVHARGYGMADLERGVPIDEHSVFDIGSTSKQFFAFAVLLLEHDGKLSLDDDIRRHLSEMPDYGETITIRHLLHHTSGIRDYLTLMSLAGMPFANDYAEQQITALIARQKALNFRPGQQHLYSNSGYFLISEIVRRVSGTTPGEFLAERVFVPLGMRSTRLYDDYTRIVEHRAIGYLPAEDGGFATELYLFDLVGDGGVLTCIEDLRRWDENFYDNRLGGGAALIERMLTPGKLADGTELEYALGLRVSSYRGLRVVDHGGAWAGYRSQFLRFPDQHLSIAVLANLGTFNPDRKVHEIADLVLPAQLTPRIAESVAAPATAVESVAGNVVSDSVRDAAPQLDAALLAALAGSYRREDGETWDVARTDGGLQLRIGKQRFALAATADDEFTAVGAPVHVTVQFVDDGRALTVLIADEEPRSYERIERWTPSASDLAGFAGSYRSDELDTIYRVRVEDTQLVIGIGYQDDAAQLSPVVRDEFVMAGSVVHAVRDAAGKVTGLRVSAGRVRDIVFERR